MKRTVIFFSAVAIVGTSAALAAPIDQAAVPAVATACAQSENFPAADAIGGVILFSFIAGLAWERWLVPLVQRTLRGQN
jgi:hypothetical protein